MDEQARVAESKVWARPMVASGSTLYHPGNYSDQTTFWIVHPSGHASVADVLPTWHAILRSMEQIAPGER